MAVGEELRLRDAPGAQNGQIRVADSLPFLQAQGVEAQAHLAVVRGGDDTIDDLELHRGYKIESVAHRDLLLDHHADRGWGHHLPDPEGGEAGGRRLLQGLVHSNAASHFRRAARVASCEC